SRRRHTRSKRDWSSDVCSSDLAGLGLNDGQGGHGAAAVLLGQAAGPLQQAGVEVEHVAGVGLPAGGALEQQGQGAVGHRVLAEKIGRASCRERGAWGGGGGGGG